MIQGLALFCLAVSYKWVGQQWEFTDRPVSTDRPDDAIFTTLYVVSLMTLFSPTLQMKMSLQLYQVDQKSFLLDFKSLSGSREPGEELDADDPLSSSPPASRSDTSIDDRMDTDDDGPMQHQTLEFFEMCADLITALAR